MTYKRTLYGWIHRKEGLLKRITYVLQLVTMVTFQRTMGWNFFCFLFLSFGPTSQHYLQVQKTKRVIISMTDIFIFFLFVFLFFFFLQVLTRGLRTLKCCCYIFFPNQKAKCYHSNMTMLEMSICIAHIKVELFFFYFLPRVGALGEQPR